MINIEMQPTVNIKTRPTFPCCYGRKLLKVTLRELIDRPTAKQSYKESIFYAIKYIYYMFEWLCLYGKPLEVNPWPGNEFVGVKSLHDALLDYYHD